MRIISKFKDYWDSGMGQGQDRSLLFVREQEVYNGYNRVEPPKTLDPFLALARAKPDIIQQRRPAKGIFEVRVDFGMLWVAGRLYPFAKLSTTLDNGFGTEGPGRFFYDCDELAAHLATQFEMDLADIERDRRKRHPVGIYGEFKPLKSWFELAASDRLHPVAVEHRISLASCLNHEVKLNPRLADFEFFRKLPPFQCFQEMTMFWGNLAAPDRVPVVIEDKHRIPQHGFDEWSFRKLPETAR